VGKGYREMKIVLLKDIPGEGKAGEVKEVAKGYAKNYLFARGLAMAATPTAIKEAESRIQQGRTCEALNQAKLAELAKQIEGKEIRFHTRVGAANRLFGSITAADIAQELSRAVGYSIDKRKVDVAKPLRQAGSHEVTIKLAKDLESKIRVVIEPEKV